LCTRNTYEENREHVSYMNKDILGGPVNILLVSVYVHVIYKNILDDKAANDRI